MLAVLGPLAVLMSGVLGGREPIVLAVLSSGVLAWRDPIVLAVLGSLAVLTSGVLATGRDPIVLAVFSFGVLTGSRLRVVGILVPLTGTILNPELGRPARIAPSELLISRIAPRLVATAP